MCLYLDKVFIPITIDHTGSLPSELQPVCIEPPPSSLSSNCTNEDNGAHLHTVSTENHTLYS